MMHYNFPLASSARRMHAFVRTKLAEIQECRSDHSTLIHLQVLFNYSPNYVTTYCNPVGTSYLAQSTTAPGFSIPNNNPPQLVSPIASALSRALQYVRSMHVHTHCPGRPQLLSVRPVSAQ